MITATAAWLVMSCKMVSAYSLSNINLTPLALAILGPDPGVELLSAWGTDIVPVARDQSLEGISDALLVLDSENRVLDLNLAAERLFGQTRRTAFGQSIDQVWPKRSEHLPERPADMSNSREVVSDQRQHTYDVLTSPLANHRGRQLGQVITLRDITIFKRAGRP